MALIQNLTKAIEEATKSFYKLHVTEFIKQVAKNSKFSVKEDDLTKIWNEMTSTPFPVEVKIEKEKKNCESTAKGGCPCKGKISAKSKSGKYCFRHLALEDPESQKTCVQLVKTRKNDKDDVPIKRVCGKKVKKANGDIVYEMCSTHQRQAEKQKKKSKKSKTEKKSKKSKKVAEEKDEVEESEENENESEENENESEENENESEAEESGKESEVEEEEAGNEETESDKKCEHVYVRGKQAGNKCGVYACKKHKSK